MQRTSLNQIQSQRAGHVCILKKVQKQDFCDLHNIDKYCSRLSAQEIYQGSNGKMFALC